MGANPYYIQYIYNLHPIAPSTEKSTNYNNLVSGDYSKRYSNTIILRVGLLHLLVKLIQNIILVYVHYLASDIAVQDSSYPNLRKLGECWVGSYNYEWKGSTIMP